MRNVSVPLTLMANWLSRQRLCIQYNLGASTFVSATMHAPRDLHQKAASGAVDARKTEFVEALQSDLLGPVLFEKFFASPLTQIYSCSPKNSDGQVRPQKCQS